MPAKIQLIGVAEAAKYLGISTRSVFDILISGELPSYRFTDRGRYRIDPADLDAWVQSKRVEADKPA